MALHMKNMTTVEKQKLTTKDTERKTSGRQNRTDLEKDTDRLKDNERKALYRKNMTTVEKQKLTTKDTERKTSGRQNRTDLEKDTDRLKNKERMALHMKNMTTVEKQKLTAKDTERKTSGRQNRTDLEKDTDRLKDNERKALHRKNMTTVEKQGAAVKDRARKHQARKSGSIETAMNTFKKEILHGPDSVCTCCRRLLYRTSVVEVDRSAYSNADSGLLTACLDHTRWICRTCHLLLKQNKMPAMSVANNLELAPIPETLKCLTDLEARLIAQRIPFMKLLNLPKGKQRAVVGSVVNVPVDTSATCASLPRCSSSSTGFIALKLKRKVQYSGHVLYQMIRPSHVDRALQTLKMNNPLYSSVVVRTDWETAFEADDEHLWNALVNLDDLAHIEEENVVEQDIDDDITMSPKSCVEDSVHIDHGHNQSSKTDTLDKPESVHSPSISVSLDPDNLSDIDKENIVQQDIIEDISPDTCFENSVHIDHKQSTQTDTMDRKESNHLPNTSVTLDTCLQPDDILAKGNEVFSIAPGEGRNPTPIFEDANNEVLTFPHLFPTGKFGFDVKRTVKLPLRKYFQARLLNEDTRFSSNTEYIFYAQFLAEFKQVHDSINIALRKARPNRHNREKVSAGMLKDKEKLRDMIRHDQGFQFLRNIRGSPAYCKKILYDLLAMVRILGPFTWFVTLSAADLRWPDTICVIAKQYGVSLSSEDVANLSWEERSSWIRRNPVTAARQFDHRVQQFMKHVLKSGVIGTVSDYMYRVEFQQRGSPHIHMAVWIQDAPTYKKSTDEELSEFIDKHVSCSLPDSNEPLYNLVTTLQKHSHTATCRKSGKTCRFNYPRPPSLETIICREQSDINDKESEITKEERDILKAVSQAMSETCDFSLEDLLQTLDISPLQYTSALRKSKTSNSVIHARQPCDTFINNYNKHILESWEANMDIQFVSDPYACIMYIASYMTKVEHEMGELLTSASMEATDLNLHRQLRKVGNKFLHSREVSAQEAVYRLLSLPLTQFSRQVMYVPTEVAEDRTFLLKPFSVIEEMDDEDEDVYQTGLPERYALRPYDLENMCMMEFLAWYKVDYRKPSTTSDSDSSEKRITLLNNGGVMTKRQTMSVIRTHKHSLKKYPEKYYHSLLMSFYPWRTEDDLLNPHNSFSSKFQSVSDIIKANQAPFDHNADEIDRAIEDLEEFGPPENAWDELLSENQHQRHSEREEGSQEANEFAINDPDLHVGAHQASRSQCSPYTSTFMQYIMPDVQYYNHVRSLNREQRQILNVFIRWCFDIRTGLKTSCVPQPINVFVNGSAGTGKSHLIKALFQTITRMLKREGDGPEDTLCALAAPTGTAARNINGQTLHSAFQLSVYKGTGSDSVSHKTLASLRNRYANLKSIIIDEISMVGADNLYKLHRRLLDIKGMQIQDHTFGGTSLICFGDLQQLAPIGQAPVFGLPSNPIARLHGALWNEMQFSELHQIMRQRDDMSFAELLRRIRDFHTQDDAQRESDIHILESRIVNDNLKPPPDALHVFATNAAVDKHNQQHLASLGATVYNIVAQDSQTDIQTGRLKLDIPDSPNLTAGLRTNVQVALGARIMITKNVDTSDGLVNGMQGTVRSFFPPPSAELSGSYQPLFILAELDDPTAGTLARQSHPGVVPRGSRLVPIAKEEAKFSVGKYKVAEVTRRQFPLTLSWACTIHKVQGMTLDKIVISCKGHFNPGQFYVAVSRVKSLNGLYFLDFEKKKIITNKPASIAVGLMRISRPLTIISMWTSDEHSIVVSALNTNSLKAHFPDITSDELLLSSDIIGLCETWLHPSQHSKHFHVPGFQIKRSDRAQCYDQEMSSDLQKHGGVLQFVSNNLSVKSVSHNEIIGLEYLAVTFTPPSEEKSVRVTVVIIYRPPWNKLPPFLDKMESLLMQLPKSEPVLVTGDFNVPANIPRSKTLQSVFRAHGFDLLQTGPTHISGSTIDLAFIRRGVVTDIRVLPVYYSHHAALQVRVYFK